MFTTRIERDVMATVINYKYCLSRYTRALNLRAQPSMWNTFIMLTLPLLRQQMITTVVIIVVVIDVVVTVVLVPVTNISLLLIFWLFLLPV